MFRLTLKLLIPIFLCVPAFATDSGEYQRLKPITHHEGHGHAHAPSARPEEQSTAELTPDQLTQQLVDDIHEISHDHDERRTLKNVARSWIKQFNLIHSGRDLVRFASMRMHTNPALKEHAANLALLFGASHVLETLSGPVGALTGAALGLPEAVNWAILAVGGVISIPGLDPVCLALAATYKISPGFRTKVTGFRLQLKRATKFTLWWAARHEWQSGKDRLMASIESTDQGLFLNLPGGTLTFKTLGEELWLHQVKVDDADKLKKSWTSAGKTFDRNTRQAVNEAIGMDIDKLPFYAQKAETGDDWSRITFRDGAIQPFGRLRHCTQILK